MVKESGVKQKKEKKSIFSGVAHIKATFNNTIITISDMKGDVLSWASSGSLGFKGSKKSTPFAAQLVAESAGRKAQEFGIQNLDVAVCGPGSGRESALRMLGSMFTVVSIRDTTPVPHNGTRLPKRRRA